MRVLNITQVNLLNCSGLIAMIDSNNGRQANVKIERSIK